MEASNPSPSTFTKNKDASLNFKYQSIKRNRTSINILILPITVLHNWTKKEPLICKFVFILPSLNLVPYDKTVNGICHVFSRYRKY